MLNAPGSCHVKNDLIALERLGGEKKRSVESNRIFNDKLIAVKHLISDVTG